MTGIPLVLCHVRRTASYRKRSTGMSLDDEFEKYLDDQSRDDPSAGDRNDSILTPEDIEQIIRESADELSRRGMLGWVLELMPPEEKLSLDDPDLVGAARKIIAPPSDRRSRGA